MGVGFEGCERKRRVKIAKNPCETDYGAHAIAAAVARRFKGFRNQSRATRARRQGGNVAPGADILWSLTGSATYAPNVEVSKLNGRSFNHDSNERLSEMLGAKWAS